MRAQFVFPVLAAILILGIFGSAQDVFAPKKLFVGGLSWDTDSQSFVVTGEVNHGMVKAVEKAGFTLQITINILDTQLVDSYTPSFDADGAFSQSIPWDRILDDGSAFEGLADVAAELQILNPAGKTAGLSVDKFERILVDSSNTPPTIESVSMVDILDRPIPEGGLVLSFHPTECRANNVIDEDGDIVTLSFDWFKEDGTLVFTGQFLPGQIGATIGIADQDRIFCTATPFDGTDFGTPVNSPTGIYHYSGGGGGL